MKLGFIHFAPSPRMLDNTVVELQSFLYTVNEKCASNYFVTFTRSVVVLFFFVHKKSERRAIQRTKRLKSSSLVNIVESIFGLLFRYLSLSLSLSLTHSLTLSHTHTHTLSLSFSFMVGFRSHASLFSVVLNPDVLLH